MLDITFIILTYNEEIHIGRVIENILPIANKIIVVDCYSTDKTCEICKQFDKVQVVQHKWPGNQAKQFNWALDNINIDTQWVFRLDADEYLTEELIYELKAKLHNLSENVSAIVFPLGRAFLGSLLKHEEVNYMIRMFRNGKARYGDSLMDEHLQVTEGEIVTFVNKFIDDNRNTLTFFLDKHIKYADREARQMLATDLLDVDKEKNSDFCNEVKIIKKKKEKYAKLPMFWRAFFYFCVRYFIKLSFLDGKEGFLWCFFQGWWYRTLVDAKILEIKKKCNYNRDKIIEYISQ
ncbi:glycosyltransferase family 2 protein [Parabacteroides distasonis]|nr:glycosyltransferase family 2 protein [Parabacteroides distasonis]